MSETPTWTDAGLKTHPDLTVTGVLASALPVDLGTVDAPERYTVPAVFVRQPLPREVALIEGSSAQQELAEAGYGHVTLKVVDGRLEIGQTSLAELKTGLASLIGSILHDASVLVGDQDAARVADLKAFAEREAQRSRMVVQSASEISFDRVPGRAPVEPPDRG